MRIAGWILLLIGFLLCISVAWATLGFLLMGVGLVSLRERAAELGGRSEVTCPPGGGTVVRAWLPLGRSA